MYLKPLSVVLKQYMDMKICREIVQGFDLVNKSIHDPEWTWFRIFILILCFLMVFVGNGFTASIWLYERYGGDPQKRIIINRIGMHLVQSGICITSTGIVTILISLTFGPLPTDVVHVTYLFANLFFATVALLALNEMAILRFLSRTVWKRIPPIHEDFFSIFFLALNYLIGFCRAWWGSLGQSSDKDVFLILSGLPLNDFDRPNLR